MTLTRTARAASAAVVAGVAAVASYSHMRDLAAEHGQSPLLANLLPVSVDGMLIVASAVMADDRGAGRPARVSAQVSFVVGVAASIVANVLAAQPNLVARVISAWPALALLLVVEMLAFGKPQTAKAAERAEQTASAEDRQTPPRNPAPAADPTSGAAAPVQTPAPRPARPSKAQRVRGPAVRLVQSDKDEPDLAKLRAWQSDNDGRMPSLGQIEKLADCGRSKAVRLRDRLAAEATEDADRAAV